MWESRKPAAGAQRRRTTGRVGRRRGPFGLVVCLGLPVLALLGGCFVDFSAREEADAGTECGNGIAEAGESCDGTDLAGQTCHSLGRGDGTLACRADCQGYVILNCGQPGCGDGVKDPGEECDGEDLGGVTCASLGLAGGELSCALNCSELDTSGCELRPSGAACTEDAQCAGMLCWTEGASGYPSGICTAVCTTPEDCGATEDCVVPPTEVSGGCVPTCEDGQTCRPGYACFDYYGTGTSVCWPHCLENDDCPFVGICNRWTGRCEEPSASAATNGAQCSNWSDCLGEVCLEPSGITPGYCASPCAKSDGTCPGSNVCVPWPAPDLPDDLGMCLAGCASAPDCDVGQDCYDAFNVGMLVCWP